MRRQTLNGIQGTLGVVGLEVTDQLADDEGQLDLKVHVNALGAQAGALAREDNGGGRLEEEEGLLGLGVVELGNVVPARGLVPGSLQTRFIMRNRRATHA